MVQKIKHIGLALILPAVIALVWQTASVFQWFPRWLFPTPGETLATFWQLAREGMLMRLAASSMRNVLPAFFAGIFIATAVGVAIGISPTMKRILFPSITALYPIPSLAWLPLLIIFFGFTRLTIWSVIFVSAFMRMIYMAIGGVQAVDHRWILAAKNLGLHKLEIIFRVIMPGALPHLMSGMRMAFGSSWRSLIGAEMLVATLGGLGKFIWYAQWQMDFAKVFSGLIIIAIIGMAAEQWVFKPIERKTLQKWGIVRPVEI